MTAPTTATPTSSMRVPGSAEYAVVYSPTADRKALQARGRPPRPFNSTGGSGGGAPGVAVARAQILKASVRNEPVVDPGDPDVFIYGTTRPNKSNTGLSDRAAVQVYNPSSSHTFPNAAYPNGTAANPTIVRDLWFTNKVSISGLWFRFENCLFSGGWAINEPPIQQTNVNARNTVFFRCAVRPQNPRSDTPFAKGHHMTFDRCHIRGCTDGIAHIGVDTAGGNGGNYAGVDQGLIALGCLIEKGAYRSPDYGAAGKLPDNASHLDLGMQSRGGDRFLFRGCAIYGFIDPDIGDGGKPSVDMPLSGTHVSGKRVSHTGLYTLSLFMFSPNLGEIRNWVCELCWLDGSDIPFVLAERLSGISILNNRVGRDQRGQVGLILAKLEAVVPLTGNHFFYELGPNGEKWPYDRQPDADQGETMPSAGKIAEWTAAGISPTDENTWPSANLRARG